MSFEDLYLQLKDQVRRTAYSLSGSEDLDDIVQDTFLRLWKSLDSFRGDSDARTWAYRVTVNSVREHWRKRGRHKAALARYAEEPKALAQAPAQEDWELSQALNQALASLSLEHRETVTLCYLEELSQEEAAQALGIPEGTVKSRLHHARQALAAAMEEHEGGSKP